jgi:hypothetical protein
VRNRTLVAFGQILRLTAAIRLIGGREVVTAVDEVQAALIVPFASMLATSKVPEEDQVPLRAAVTLAESAMATELHLSDGGS